MGQRPFSGVKGSRGQEKKLKSYSLQPPTSNSIRGGFTLIEIMIALAILGIVITTVFSTINYHADVTYNDTIKTMILMTAREQIAEMELQPENKEGTIPGTDWKFENSVINTEEKNIVELKTVISGNGKKVVLSELIIKK